MSTYRETFKMAMRHWLSRSYKTLYNGLQADVHLRSMSTKEGTHLLTRAAASPLAQTETQSLDQEAQTLGEETKMPQEQDNSIEPEKESKMPQEQDNSTEPEKVVHFPFPKTPNLAQAEAQPARWVVDRTEDGSRLDRFIKRRAPGVPPGLIQRLIRQRKVHVNGEEADRNAWPVRTDDNIRFPGHIKLGLSRHKRRPQADDISLSEAALVSSWVLHRDARAAVLNKPAGLATDPQGPSFINPKILRRERKKPAHEREEFGSGSGPLGADGSRCLSDLLSGIGSGRYWLVHRLDKEVAGAIVMARDVGAAGLLAEYFRSRLVQKTYWALVQGRMQYKKGSVQTEVDGKRAYTGYRVVQKVDNLYSWLELTPRTGRKHQLRIHCAEGLGCPIVGEMRYGASALGGGHGGKSKDYDEDDENAGITFGTGLHLMSRNIKYPKLTDDSVNGQGRRKSRAVRYVDVSAPLPPHMQDTWKRLGLREEMGSLPHHDD